jgi:hypothetical protein
MSHRHVIIIRVAGKSLLPSHHESLVTLQQPALASPLPLPSGSLIPLDIICDLNLSFIWNSDPMDNFSGWGFGIRMVLNWWYIHWLVYICGMSLVQICLKDYPMHIP